MNIVKYSWHCMQAEVIIKNRRRKLQNSLSEHINKWHICLMIFKFLWGIVNKNRYFNSHMKLNKIFREYLFKFEIRLSYQQRMKELWQSSLYKKLKIRELTKYITKKNIPCWENNEYVYLQTSSILEKANKTYRKNFLR